MACLWRAAFSRAWKVKKPLRRKLRKGLAGLQIPFSAMRARAMSGRWRHRGDGRAPDSRPQSSISLHASARHRRPRGAGGVRWNDGKAGRGRLRFFDEGGSYKGGTQSQEFRHFPRLGIARKQGFHIASPILVQLTIDVSHDQTFIKAALYGAVELSSDKQIVHKNSPADWALQGTKAVRLASAAIISLNSVQHVVCMDVPAIGWHDPEPPFPWSGSVPFPKG